MNIKSKLCFLLCMVSINSYQGAESNYLKFEEIVRDKKMIGENYGMTDFLNIVDSFNQIAYGNLQASGDNLTLFNSLKLNVKDDTTSSFLSLRDYFSQHNKIPNFYQIADEDKEQFIKILVKYFPFYTEGQVPEYVAKMQTIYTELFYVEGFVKSNESKRDAQLTKDYQSINEDIVKSRFTMEMIYEILSNINEYQRNLDGANGEDQEKNDAILQAIQVKIDEYPDNFIIEQIKKRKAFQMDDLTEEEREKLYVEIESYRKDANNNIKDMNSIINLLINPSNETLVRWLKGEKNFQAMVKNILWQKNPLDINTLMEYLTYRFKLERTEFTALDMALWNSSGIKKSEFDKNFDIDFLDITSIDDKDNSSIKNESIQTISEFFKKNSKVIEDKKQKLLKALVVKRSGQNQQDWINEMIEKIKDFCGHKRIGMTNRYYSINYGVIGVLCKVLCKEPIDDKDADINIQTMINYLENKASTMTEEEPTEEITPKVSDYIALLKAIDKDEYIKKPKMDFNIKTFLPPLEKPSAQIPDKKEDQDHRETKEDQDHRETKEDQDHREKTPHKSEYQYHPEIEEDQDYTETTLEDLEKQLQTSGDTDTQRQLETPKYQENLPTQNPQDVPSDESSSSNQNLSIATASGIAAIGLLAAMIGFSKTKTINRNPKNVEQIPNQTQQFQNYPNQQFENYPNQQFENYEQAW